MKLRPPPRNKRPAMQMIDNTFQRVAPVFGWNARDPLANMDHRFAVQLENWFPVPGGVQLRNGAAAHSTGYPLVVESLMVWNAASGTPSSRLFAVTDAGIYDATSAGAVGAIVQARTIGEALYTNFRTSGNSYLVTVNATDDLAHYNGTTWTTVPNYALSGGGSINTNEFSHVNVFKRRLFFVRRNSLDFVYLGLDSIGGNASIFPLGGLFAKGGHLVAMGTWTIDGGNGVDDLAVFITSKGQIAVYKGSDPGSASDWSLVGVYDLAAPIGKKCFLKYGGDLLLILRSGIFPLSKAIQSAVTNPKAAITNNIDGAFSLAAASYGGNYGWEAQHLFDKELLIVNIPTAALTSATQYIMNTVTGAWAQITGWNATCFEIFNGELYMGVERPGVHQVAHAWTGGNDFGNQITALAKTAFDYFDVRGVNKQIKALRTLLTVSGTVGINVAVDVDFREGSSFPSPTFPAAPGATWGPSPPTEGIWDTSVWAGEGEIRTDWMTVAAYPGRCAATRLRAIAIDATVFWSATDFLTEDAGVIS